MAVVVKAKLKSTGKEIEVYKSVLRDTYVLFEDCKTEYKKEDLVF